MAYGKRVGVGGVIGFDRIEIPRDQKDRPPWYRLPKARLLLRPREGLAARLPDTFGVPARNGAEARCPCPYIRGHPDLVAPALAAPVIAACREIMRRPR